MTKRFFKNNLIFMASTVLGGLLGYFFHFVVSRKLSVSQYGELQAITSLTMIFGVFSSALSYFVIKYSSVLASYNDREGQSHFLSYLVQKFKIPVLGLLVLYMLLLPALKTILRLTDYFGLLAIGISVVFFIFFAFYFNSLQGWKKFLTVGAIGVTAVAAKLAGGCILTDKEYSEKLRKLIREIGRIRESDLKLLRLGRHFWACPVRKTNVLETKNVSLKDKRSKKIAEPKLSNGVKVILGRNHGENLKLKKIAEFGDILIEPKNIPGPLALVRGKNKEAIKLAKEKIIKYAKKLKNKNPEFVILDI